MDFSDALNHIKNGAKVSRTGWNGKNMFLFLIPGGTFTHPILGAKSVDAAPFVAIFNAQQVVVPWLPSQGDLLADDWKVI